MNFDYLGRARVSNKSTIQLFIPWNFEELTEYWLNKNLDIIKSNHPLLGISATLY